MIAEIVAAASPFALAVVFAAYLVRGIAGFGSGLIAIPLLALDHPLELVVPIVVLFDLVGSAGQAVRGRRAVAWHELVPLVPGALAGVGIALWMLVTVDAEPLTRAFGAFILAFAVYQVLPLPPLEGSRAWAFPAGLVGGSVGTAFGIGGPAYMMYLSARNLDKATVRSSFAAWFCVEGAVRIAGFLLIGALGAHALPSLLAWAPAVVAGLVVGGRLHALASPVAFRRAISLVLLASGARLLFA